MFWSIYFGVLAALVTAGLLISLIDKVQAWVHYYKNGKTHVTLHQVK